MLPPELIDKIFLEPYETGIKRIPDGAIDLILTDPPYGVTDCAWDVRPDLDFMWREFNRVLKPNGAAVITATQPFATDLINANRKWFRYDLVWVKSNPVGFLNSHRMPMRQHELVLVFYRRLPTYNPQMIPSAPRVSRALKDVEDRGGGVYRKTKKLAYEHEGHYPTSILPFKKDGAGKSRHPTQKPLALFEYLINTYSNPGEIIFDPFIGAGTTGIAAHHLMRSFLGFEIERCYYEKAMERLINKVEYHTP